MYNTGLPAAAAAQDHCASGIFVRQTRAAHPTPACGCLSVPHTPASRQLVATANACLVGGASRPSRL